MTFVKLTACGFLLAFGLVMSAQATVIADFDGDYVPGTQGQTRAQVSADGWNYMWNDGANSWGGPIGSAGNYASLMYCDSMSRYTVTGNYPGYYPGYYLCFTPDGGVMPGEGTQQIGTSDSFAIAAYTIQDGEAGLVSISDSSFSVLAAASTGVELRVYVNDTLKTSFVQAGGATSSFDISLGSLHVGDTVYVAAGPNGIDYDDWSDLSYQLTSEPNPTPNRAFDVPQIGTVTIDGNLSDWSNSTAWSEDFVFWNGTGLPGTTTKAKFAWNDAGDMLYVAIQTDQANGGHPVVGVGTAVDSIPATGVGSTQLGFDAGTGNTVAIMNEFTAYGIGSQGTNGIVAAQTNDGTTWTYELAIPYWKDWTTMAEKQTISANDEYFAYLVMQDAFGTANGTDMTYVGNPNWGGTGFAEASKLTFKASSQIPGDANSDGKVDGSDVTILAGNWQVLTGATWAMGDFNGDHKVDGSDVTILAGNWQTGVTATAAAVPEPSSMLLILSAIAAMLIWRRSK